MPMLQELTTVRSSISQAAAGQMMNLPVMSSAELCALDAVTHPVLDKPALDWWSSRGDQQNLTQMAYSELVRRELYDPATGRVTPPLDLILAARAKPAFIVVTRDKPDAEPRPGRLYGAADDWGKRAVLREEVRPNPASWSGPSYSYQPTKIQAEASAIVEWASARKGRTIDLYLPGTGVVSRPVERIVVASPVRRELMTFRREAMQSIITFHPKTLTSILVSFMSGFSYVHGRLPISY